MEHQLALEPLDLLLQLFDDGIDAGVHIRRAVLAAQEDPIALDLDLDHVPVPLDGLRDLGFLDITKVLLQLLQLLLDVGFQ